MDVENKSHALYLQTKPSESLGDSEGFVLQKYQML